MFIKVYEQIGKYFYNSLVGITTRLYKVHKIHNWRYKTRKGLLFFGRISNIFDVRIWEFRTLCGQNIYLLIVYGKLILFYAINSWRKTSVLRFRKRYTPSLIGKRGEGTETLTRTCTKPVVLQSSTLHLSINWIDECQFGRENMMTVTLLLYGTDQTTRCFLLYVHLVSTESTEVVSSRLIPSHRLGSILALSVGWFGFGSSRQWVSEVSTYWTLFTNDKIQWFKTSTMSSSWLGLYTVILYVKGHVDHHDHLLKWKR